ncbi:MAG: hypothetical protein PVG69_15295, partial [Desulfobacterales bacterium]
MVDETNKDDTQNEKQTEIADDTAMEQMKTESEPQKDEITAQQSAAGSSEDTSKLPGDSMESVMDMYEESFKR